MNEAAIKHAWCETPATAVEIGAWKKMWGPKAILYQNSTTSAPLVLTSMERLDALHARMDQVLLETRATVEHRVKKMVPA